MLTIDSAQFILRQAGIRLTPQRMMIIEVLVGNRSHPTVESVYDAVHASYPTISLATVYHTLSLLANHGLILQLRGAKDAVHCDPDTSPHAHAYCEDCGAVFDLPLADEPVWNIETLAGFHPAKIEVSLYGRCGQCAAKHN